jgi:hypothetical protein
LARENARRGLALPCLEAAIRLVDDIDAAAAANDSAITVPGLQRLERITDFHRARRLVSKKLRCRKVLENRGAN